MKFENELKIIKKGVEEIIPLDELVKKLEKSEKTGKPLRIKYGIDPTGFDVHIGHLVPIRKMRDFQDMGHTGVIIIGDFTAQIGDPTGRDESRPPLTKELILENSSKYMEQLFTVLDPAKTEIRYQTEWFGKMGMTDVIKLMGKFTLAQFLAHDTFRNRYEQGLPLGMHEIMYPILQGYDSVAIESDIELGATEQKFNILAGRDMQRYFGQEQQIAVLSPILMGTDGINKMSKSMNNYIAVFDPPNEKFGKVMSIPDSLIVNYYNYATTLHPDEIAAIKAELEKGTNPMLMKKRLGWEIVKLYHGPEAADTAREAFEKQFSQKELPEDIPLFKANEANMKLMRILTEGGLCETNGEAKRLIMQGGVSVDGEKVTAFDSELVLKDGMVIKCGKRKYLRIAL